MNKHTISEVEAEWLVEQFDVLLRKQLVRLQIYPNNSDYQDFLQEGRIILIKTASEFEIDWQESAERFRFMNVVGKRFRWHCLDVFRKPVRKKENTVDPDDYHFKSQVDPQANDFVEMIESDELLSIIYQKLTADEWQLLVALLDERQKRTEIAKAFGLTRRQLYTQRAKLKRKIEPIYRSWKK